MGRSRVLLAFAVVAAASVLALSGKWPWRRFEVRTAALDPPPVAFRETTDTLQRGETLGALFDRQGVAGVDLVSLFERAGLDPRRLKAGLEVQFRRQEGEVAPVEIRMRSSQDERFAVRRAGNAWVSERSVVPWRSEVIRIEGGIESSLYDAMADAIPESLFDAESRIRLAWDLADVYAWSVDFNRDIQSGDRFAVLVEREVSDEGEVRVGSILAADLLSSGKHLNAFRFDDGSGQGRFYDAEGESLRRAFLRAPVEFRRISSTFSRSRYHPVLGIWRRHEGTDYAAGSGTPVMASGDGTVLRAGRSGGYGNLVEVRHRNGITTRYGHLRGFARGISAGTRVSQGQVIGFVGSTGLASGPHLHYEFRVNGAARDSRKVDLGGGEPIAKRFFAAFQLERARLAQALGTARAPNPVAIAEE